MNIHQLSCEGAPRGRCVVVAAIHDAWHAGFVLAAWGVGSCTTNEVRVRMFVRSNYAQDGSELDSLPPASSNAMSRGKETRAPIAFASIAVKLGSTRLIDNVLLE